jgi:hypothetical protein
LAKTIPHSQAGDDIISRLALEFAGAEVLGGLPGIGRCFAPPRFEAAPAE